MDNRSFISRLSKAAGFDTKTTSNLASDVANIIAEAATNLDSVAIPGFGTFEPEKTDEHIETDASNGARRLVPPHISLNFKPGSRLKKALKR